jgi:beta-lactamase class A
LDEAPLRSESLCRRSNMMIERRDFLAGTMAMAGFVATPSCHAAAVKRTDVSPEIRALETGAARLGVCFLDTASGEHSGHRMDQHFATNSTFKLAMVAAILREADAGRINLSEVLPYTQADLLSWAPVTGPNLARGGLPIAALAQAAQQQSDGTAANLLVRRLGGPAALTDKLREMGDPVTQMERYEPDLGMVLSGDHRDTTQPLAMARLVGRICTGNLLKPETRAMLLTWMENTQTGTKRLRAGLPAEWRSGNKTGTGRAPGTTNKYNDIAITFPPGRAPIIITAYYDSGEYTEQIEDRHQAVLAEVGRIAARWAKS